MITFEVSVNGKRLCSAGVAEAGVLAANLTWALGAVGEPEECLGLTVGAFKSRVNEHLTWLNHTLKRDDVVSIRIVESKKVDRPHTRKKENQKLRLKQQKDYVRHMAKEFGWLIQVPKKKRVKPSRDRTR